MGNRSNKQLPTIRPKEKNDAEPERRKDEDTQVYSAKGPHDFRPFHATHGQIATAKAKGETQSNFQNFQARLSWVGSASGFLPKGAPGVTRTPNLRVRSPVLYPIELRARVVKTELSRLEQGLRPRPLLRSQRMVRTVKVQGHARAARPPLLENRRGLLPNTSDTTWL